MLKCKQCGFENSIGIIFCQRCLSNLRNSTSFDIAMDDFLTEGDQDAFEILEEAKPIFSILYSTLIKFRLRNLTEKMSKITKKSTFYKKIGMLNIECGDILSLDRLPDIHMTDLRQKNAFTTEINSKPVIIIDSSLINYLSHDEMRSLIGHEMGHIKCHHLLYHSIAELLEQGLEFSTSLMGFRLLSIPLKLALKAWHRESEFSADRASLIVTDNLNSIASMFTKIVENPNTVQFKTNLNSFFEILSNHPTHLNRLNTLKDFSDSTQYLKIKKKLQQRRIFEKAFINKCRFCGEVKNIEDIICPNCNKSLV